MYFNVMQKYKKTNLFCRLVFSVDDFLLQINTNNLIYLFKTLLSQFITQSILDLFFYKFKYLLFLSNVFFK